MDWTASRGTTRTPRARGSRRSALGCHTSARGLSGGTQVTPAPTSWRDAVNVLSSGPPKEMRTSGRLEFTPRLPKRAPPADLTAAATPARARETAWAPATGAAARRLVVTMFATADRPNAG